MQWFESCFDFFREVPWPQVDVWNRLCGSKVGFQYNTYMGERSTASRNYSLAHMMDEEQSRPRSPPHFDRNEGGVVLCPGHMD